MRYRALLLAAFAGCLMGAVKAYAVPIDDPPGTYQQSCNNISVRGDDLRARCKDNYGHYHDTVLDHADRCWGDISNNNGNLVCLQRGGPSGSFTQSCRDISVRWGVMRARCQTRDGRWVDTSLDQYSRCNGEITNEDGELRCGGRGFDHDRDRGRGYAPPGSYSQTCRDIRTRGDDLTAVCMTANRQWVDTALDHFNRCVGEIVNDDGRLECTRQGGRLVPRGSYSESCRNIYVRGDYLRAECQDRRGGWNWSQLNDWDDCRHGIVNDDGRLRCNR
jgi:hypothetical protein